MYLKLFCFCNLKTNFKVSKDTSLHEKICISTTFNSELHVMSVMILDKK